jgi:hypothetical protein
MLNNRLSKWMWVAAVFCCLLMFGPSASGQSIYATLTGVVTDPSQAVVPNAKITLKNTASGDTRRSVTNSDGYFTFVSVPVGEGYELTVEAAGFQTSKVPGLAFTGAEKRNLNVTMKVGSTTETVEVTGAADLVTPVDSGEKSATLTTKQLQDFSVVGRSAAEFIKILPGFSIANTGTENRANFTGETIGINGNGEGGSQSALNGAYAVNGLPGGSLDITADGAHVSDPGCNCATPVNPNTDMIQEFKVLTSNFSAENQKGPAVISSVAKSGGKDFHGSAYLYARHYSLNSNNWLNNRQGTDSITGKPVAPRPQNKYFFPGGNLSGPIVIPGTKFNRNRDKWFFFTGYEHYFQTIDTGLLRATVPTAGMRGGNFSETELKKIEGTINGNPVTSSGGAAQRPNSTLFPGGIIPTNQIDRSGQALMNLLPNPNVNPNQTGGFNYVEQIVFDQNSRQWLTRIDNNISDNTKLYFRYNYQREVQTFPVGLWWRNGNQVPYPTPVDGRNKSDSISASLTHVFSPTMTNEFVFGYTFIAFPNVLRDPSKVDRAKVGYNYYCIPRVFQPTSSLLYRNNGDGTFTLVSKGTDIERALGKGLGVVATDINNDGWMDLFQANDTVQNFLFKNKGGKGWEEIGLPAEIAFSVNGQARSGMGVDSADFSGDGWDDLFVANVDQEMFSLYRNNRDETFADVAHQNAVAQATRLYIGWGLKFFDYDNDGNIDLILANGHPDDMIENYSQQVKYKEPLLLFHNEGGKLRNVSSSAGPVFEKAFPARGLAVGDYNNDGLLDVLVANCGEAPALLKNCNASGNHWIGVRLVGKTANRDAVGARIRWSAGATVRQRQKNSGGSYLSSHDPREVLGLGSATAVDWIEVKWPGPSTRVERFTPEGVDKYITLEEGRGQAVPPVKPRPGQ